MVKVKIPASTSNLGSGFDCIGLALQLYLTVEIEITPRGLQISVSGEGASDIPTNNENLVFRSAKELFKKVKKELPGLEIKIENQIPLFRGLGSSGAATVAGLLCASKLTNSNLTAQEILSVAYKIEGHPENASSSLFGGLTINCTENGNVITKTVAIDKNMKVVLLIPDQNISTNTARQALPKNISHRDAVFNLQRSALLVHSFSTGDYETLKFAMQDRLHQPFRKKLIPGYDTFETVGYQNGAIGICISGSGSTILGLTVGDGRQLQKCWLLKARELNLSAKIVIMEIDTTGAIFL